MKRKPINKRTKLPKMKRKGKLKEKLQAASSRIPEEMRNTHTQLPEAQLSPEQYKSEYKKEAKGRQGGSVS